MGRFLFSYKLAKVLKTGKIILPHDGPQTEKYLISLLISSDTLATSIAVLINAKSDLGLEA